MDEKATKDSEQILNGKAAAKHFGAAFLFYDTKNEKGESTVLGTRHPIRKIKKLRQERQ